MAPRIAVFGSANMDLVATASHLPAPGETVLGHGFATVPGGKGANQAIASARAGAECVFLGAVGDDPFGAELLANLAASTVDVSAVRTVPGPSGVALVTVDEAGENTIVVVPGANAALTAIEAAERAAIVAADVLVCQLEVPVEAVTEAARLAHASGVRVVLNAAPARRLPDALAAAVDLLIVNEREAATIGEPPVPRLVLTLGAAGARYADRDGVRLAVPAPEVRAVDSTAAGDAFTGAFAVAWAEGRPVDEALRWACTAGALCATRPGASTSLPDRHEIEARYEAVRSRT